MNFNDLSSLLGSSSSQPAQGGGGSAGSTIGGLGGAAIGTALLPGVGTALGGSLGAAIGGMFGGHGVPNHEDPDATTIANAIGVTVGQAKDLCAMIEDEAGKGGPNFDDIVKDYAQHPQELLAVIPRYNRKHPEKPIYPSTGAAAVQGYQQNTSVLTPPAGFPPLATTPFVVQNSASTSASPAANDLTKYAIFGGGGLVVLLIIILLLRK